MVAEIGSSSNAEVLKNHFAWEAIDATQHRVFGSRTCSGQHNEDLSRDLYEVVDRIFWSTLGEQA